MGDAYSLMAYTDVEMERIQKLMDELIREQVKKDMEWDEDSNKGE